MNVALMSEHEEEKQKAVMIYGVIKLNPGFTIYNYAALFIHCMCITIFFAAFEIMFNMILTSPQYYAVPSKDAASIFGNIVLIDMIFRMIVAGPVGILHDKLGRRIMILIGFLGGGLGMCLVPFQANIYLLAIVRTISGCTVLCSSMAPLLADYVDDEYKGRAAGVNVVAAALGAALTVGFIKFAADAGITYGQLYVGFGLLILIGGFIAVLFARGGVYHSHHAPGGKQSSMLQGIKVAKHPWIFMGYFITFLARGVSFLSASPMVLYVQYFIPGDISLANSISSKLSAVCYTVIFLAGGVVGYYMDKISKFLSVGSALGFTLGGLIGIIMIDNPQNSITMFFMGILGLGIAGISGLATYLVDAFTPEAHRGKAHGVQAICSVLGVVVCANLGGNLFKHFKDSFFLIFIGFSIMAMIILGLIWVNQHWLEKFDGKKDFTEEEDINHMIIPPALGEVPMQPPIPTETTGY